MNIWILMILVGVCTFSFRASWILTAGRYEMPKGLERSLRFVPAAALSALIAPQFFVIHGELSVSPTNERLLAGIVAAVVAGVTKNMLATIGAGMGAFWLLRFLGV